MFYVTEIVLSLGFADAIFRRERSDDRKCVCASQAINQLISLTMCQQLNSPHYRVQTMFVIMVWRKPLRKKQTMTSIGIGRVWGNGICFGIFTQLIDRAGAPNENIVQNHLRRFVERFLLIQTVDIGIFLSPKNFSSVRIS